jgi:hypothetical protein
MDSSGSGQDTVVDSCADSLAVRFKCCAQLPVIFSSTEESTEKNFLPCHLQNDNLDILYVALVL